MPPDIGGKFGSPAAAIAVHCPKILCRLRNSSSGVMVPAATLDSKQSRSIR
jgi:hypothetical protein